MMFINNGSGTFSQRRDSSLYSQLGPVMHCYLSNAHLVFEEIPEPNLVSWTSMISSYVHDGQYYVGLRMYYLMLQSGLRPNEFVCPGFAYHGQVLKSGFEWYSFCSSSILGIYVAHGDVGDAYKVLPWDSGGESIWSILEYIDR
ncbi:Pentatricopeptide repeat [Trema orientale]|uniref:Pentatricopeptide repeat n=1 Tax=Trema orientale TaxID=63057 RepID=A0A2P5BXA2_TREOI|nr:Pentatricopeptide repeat [Trema orientale]